MADADGSGYDSYGNNGILSIDERTGEITALSRGKSTITLVVKDNENTFKDTRIVMVLDERDDTGWERLLLYSQGFCDGALAYLQGMITFLTSADLFWGFVWDVLKDPTAYAHMLIPFGFSLDKFYEGFAEILEYHDPYASGVAINQSWE